MKKTRFIDLVCERLQELGATETELSKQRVHINGYLTGLGIGEESQELDYESPSDFADEIFEIIKAHRPEIKPTVQDVSADDDKASEDEAEYDDDDDVKLFVPGAADGFTEMPDIMGDDEGATDGYSDGDQGLEDETDADNTEEYDPSASDAFDELGESLEVEHSDEYGDGDEDYTEPGATREYDINELLSENDEEEENEDDGDDEDELDDKPVGNPVFFWILTVVLSPVWLPIAALAAVLSVALFLLLSVFIVVYIPLLIAVILGGSLAVLAELIYSIVRLVTGQIHIGLFELGLGFVVAALVVCLSVLIYRFGTKYAPGVWKGYWRGVARLFKKLKRLVRRFRRACSI